MKKTFDFDSAFKKMMDNAGTTNVVILGHVLPDGDAAGCVMGLAHYIHAVYPYYSVYPHLENRMADSIKMIIDRDKVFDPYVRPETVNYAVIVCDTGTVERIYGKDLYESASAAMNIDHHEANDLFGDRIFRTIDEACAAVITGSLGKESFSRAVLMDKQVHPDSPTAADYLYMGIMHDTGKFKRVSRLVFNSASFLIANGADHKMISDAMDMKTLPELLMESTLYLLTETAGEGRICYIIADREKIERYGITEHDIHPVSGILRNLHGVDAAFTMYERENGELKFSFRSDDTVIDVNALVKPYNGGGHKGAAGLVIRTDDYKELVKELLAKLTELLYMSCH